MQKTAWSKRLSVRGRFRRFNLDTLMSSRLQIVGNMQGPRYIETSRGNADCDDNVTIRANPELIMPEHKPNA